MHAMALRWLARIPMQNKSRFEQYALLFKLSLPELSCSASLKACNTMLQAL